MSETLGHQLRAAGIDMDAAKMVRMVWSVSCQQDDACRFACVHLRSREDAEGAAQRHVSAWPGHQCRVTAHLSVSVAEIAGQGRRAS